MKNQIYLPSKEDIKQYKMLYPMINSIFNEIKELSKKKQDGVLNPLKVKTINKILSKIKSILSNEQTYEFIELLDEETLPTNSDAVIIIVQFKSALEQFKKKYFVKESGNTMGIDTVWKWNTSD